MKHGVTQGEAQGFIDSAVVMFDQVSRSLYVSGEGNSVILDADRRLISAYRRADFDLGINAILEVIQNGKDSQKAKRRPGRLCLFAIYDPDGHGRQMN